MAKIQSYSQTSKYDHRRMITRTDPVILPLFFLIGRAIGSIVFKCEGKDTNLFSNIQIFNEEKRAARPAFFCAN